MLAKATSGKFVIGVIVAVALLLTAIGWSIVFSRAGAQKPLG
jgi:hypothetical protein